jgi:hypothetical protein
MSNWKFLGKHAITTFPGNKPSEYVVVGKNVVGYAELNNDRMWTYYHFAPAEKGVSTPPEAVEKASAKTAAQAVNLGLSV